MMRDYYSNPRRRHAHGIGVVVLLALAACCAPAYAAPARAASTLYLQDGDFFSGRLEQCDTTNVVRWQAQGATRPFEFPAGAFRAAYFPPPPATPTPEGDYCFELSDGDMLYGSLVNITPEQLEVQSVQLGRLHVARSEVCRLTPYGDSSRNEYRGPNGLADWRPAGENQWNEEAGRLVTSTRHAEVQKEIVIPDQARIEFEVAWSAIPEFNFVLSAGAADEQLQTGYRFEVWNHKLVLVRSGKVDADVAVVCPLNDAADRVHLEAYYDQGTGKLSVHTLDGRELAEITVLEHEGTPLRLVSLTNLGPNVRLEQLTVGRWTGQQPARVDADKPRVQLTDGTIVYGDVIGYDPEPKQFVVQADSEEKRIDAAQVACIALIPTSKPVAHSFRVGLHNGGRFSGELMKVAGGNIYVTRPGVEEPLVCAVVDLRSLVGLVSDFHRPEGQERVGRLELAGVRSHGSLVEAAATADGIASCLVWQPRCSTTSSPLDRSASGRIVYRDPPPAPPKLTQQERELQRLQQQRRRPQPPVGVFGAVMRVLSGDETMAAPVQPKPHGAGTLYLLTGDRIPCEVSQIDEEGVHFTSPAVTSTLIPHSGVKALEFAPNSTEAALDDEKRQRLLTLPRMQKGNPPTHLVVSTTGDYLRTRLTAMTADTLTVESRLETIQIPRNRVACLIWLHDASDPAPPNPPDISPPTADKSLEALQVQAVQSDGIRLTFVPQECTGKVLSGMSNLLGACQVELNRVDALVLGSAIGSEAAEQAFQSWKLTDAVEPRYVRDSAQGGTSDRPPTSETGLVGKKAPDVRLELLEGGRFNLAEQKGHIVVLDFWASWCGPCMQAMPQVDAVVEEFSARGVKLVAVNMQEDRTAASGALERLKIDPSVALDIDGAAAEHYQVTAIPQTVVIDADGNVAQVFIGAGLDFPAQLRTAIENVLAPSAPQ